MHLHDAGERGRTVQQGGTAFLGRARAAGRACARACVALPLWAGQQQASLKKSIRNPGPNRRALANKWGLGSAAGHIGGGLSVLLEEGTEALAARVHKHK